MSLLSWIRELTTPALAAKTGKTLDVSCETRTAAGVKEATGRRENGLSENVQRLINEAENGSSLAEVDLGTAYANGDGVERDVDKADYWYRKAAERGEAEGQVMLAIRQMGPDGRPKKPEETKALLQRATSQGNPIATYLLGTLRGDAYDFDFAVLTAIVERYAFVGMFRRKAAKGDAKAQHHMGNYYFNGEGVREDRKEAAEWYRKAAEQGYAAAQFNLGTCYLTGQGVPEDKEAGFRWLSRAAQQGEAMAQFNLGVCYERGRGVSQDHREAAKWYREAAEKGFASAQVNLAVCYDTGRGVEKDLAAALRWYMRAAEQNDVDAQYSVGTFFLHGEGTQRDVPESIRWFQKASKQGHHDASCMLAKLTAVPGTPPPDKGQCSDLRNPSETHEQRKQRVLEAANASDEEVRFATNYQTILGALMNGSYHKATTGNLDEALDMHIYLELFATALGRQVTPIDSPKNARPWQMLKTPSGLITYGDFASRVARRRRAIMAQIADILINEYHDPNSAMVIQNSQEGKHNQAYRSGMEKIAILLERNDFRQDAEDLRNVKNTIQLPEPPGRWTVLS